MLKKGTTARKALDIYYYRITNGTMLEEVLVRWRLTLFDLEQKKTYQEHLEENLVKIINREIQYIQEVGVF